jgi:RimJ/RimL family protein N-acetyltransferase
MLTKKPSIDLYIAQFEGRRCGYLLLRRHSKTTWITEVVEEKFRRKGIAGEIIGFAVATKLELSAEILNSNKASIRLHERAGFVQVEKFNSFGRYVLSPTKGSSK